MKWQPGSNPYFIVSTCGYKIAKFYVGNLTKYVAFDPKGKRIGGGETSGHARKPCEDYSER